MQSKNKSKYLGMYMFYNWDYRIYFGGKVIILNKSVTFWEENNFEWKNTHPLTHQLCYHFPLSLPQNNLIKLLPSIFISITFLDAFYTIMDFIR